jgi:LysM repeat protein
VKSGDSFYTIAKANGTTIKAIEAANPGVDSRRLKIGQKLVLPATDSAAAAAPVATAADANVYVVKSGDTLSRIATSHKTTVKELKSLNGLTTDRINVGQKLKLPLPAAPAPAPVTAPLPEPTYSAPPPSAAPPTGQ